MEFELHEYQISTPLVIWGISTIVQFFLIPSDLYHLFTLHLVQWVHQPYSIVYRMCQCRCQRLNCKTAVLYHRLVVVAVDLGLSLWITLPIVGMVLLVSRRRRWSLAWKMRERIRRRLAEESRREVSHMGYVVISSVGSSKL